MLLYQPHPTPRIRRAIVPVHVVRRARDDLSLAVPMKQSASKSWSKSRTLPRQIRRGYLLNPSRAVTRQLVQYADVGGVRREESYECNHRDLRSPRTQFNMSTLNRQRNPLVGSVILFFVPTRSHRLAAVSERVTAGKRLSDGLNTRDCVSYRRSDMLATILIVVVLLMLLGALPRWSHSRQWGYFPSGGLGLVLVILIVLVLLGHL